MKTSKEDKDIPMVLIVDDNERNIGLIGQLLSRDIGCDIAIATNGSSAIEIALKILPDLILLDVMMPDISGYDVCRKLKADKRFERIPVIFITGRTDESDIAEGFACGAVDYILKPIKEAELIARVKTHLSLKEYEKKVIDQISELRKFNRVLCHDLLNPINSIMGAFELIKQDMNAEDKSIQKMGQVVDRSLNNILGLIQSVRKAYSISEGKSTLELELYSLNQLMNESLDVLSERIREKAIVIERGIPNTIFVRVDRVSFIITVINNLMSNAIKFSDRGSTVWINAENRDGRIKVWIKDKGIGMPDYIFDKLFEMTKETQRLGTEGERGTGYAMPLVKKYVEAYGGRIEVDSYSEEDESEGTVGTTITLTLLG